MTVDLRNAEPIPSLHTDTREYVFGKRYDMYSDNYKKQVTDRLTEIYANASLLKMDKQLDLTNNVYNKVMNLHNKIGNSASFLNYKFVC